MRVAPHDQLPGWVATWLSEPRLVPYVRSAGVGGALELYAWNCRAGTALFELIGWFEVAWRNNIDRAICGRRHPDAAHWLFDSAFPLQPRTWDKVASAIRNVRRGSRNPMPGQVIAELSLGFWRFTASGYRQTVWMTYLSHAFPYAPGPPHAAAMDRQLDAIIKLRNRIAHHEPIGRVEDVQRRIDDMLELGSWINPAMAGWWRGRTSVWQVLKDIPNCL